MAITTIQEQADQRTDSSSWNDLGTAQRVFQVVSSDGLDTGVKFLHGIPAYLDYHPVYPFLRCSSKASRWTDKSGREAIVTCTYSYVTAEVPWQMPYTYSYSTQSQDRIVDYDVITGQSIQNSAGQPFDPPVMATRHNFVMSVSANVLGFNVGIISQFVDHVNSSSFYGFDPGFVKCTGMPAQSQTFQFQGAIVIYHAVSIEFAFSTIPWNAVILDAGFMKLGSDGVTLVPITVGGKIPSSPVPLNGMGQPVEGFGSSSSGGFGGGGGRPLPPLEASRLGVSTAQGGDSPPDEGSLNFLQFNTYPSADFNQLGV